MMDYSISWTKWAFTSLQLLLTPAPLANPTDAIIHTSPAVSKLPVLGWSSWHVCNGSSYLCVTDMATALNSSGLSALGYKYMALDDGWQARPARVNGTLHAHPTRFPGGMKNLSVKLDSMGGFKLGIYSDAGDITCGGNDGSLGFEDVDAQTFAAWGVAYLKYDNCCVPEGHRDSEKYCPPIRPKIHTAPHCTATPLPHKCAPPTYNWKDSNTFKRYDAMSKALQTHAPDILFSMSIWGTADVTSWGAELATSWRIWRDMLSQWPRFLEIVRGASQVLHTTNFNGHNDADLLQLGNGDFTDILKARSHFALWAVMKSPLILATDIVKLVAERPDIIEVVKNPYLHAFNQDDEHGGPALPFNWPNTSAIPQYWAGPLTFNGTGGKLVLTLNIDNETKEMGFNSTQLGLNEGGKYQIVDAWTQEVVAPCPAPSAF